MLGTPLLKPESINYLGSELSYPAQNRLFDYICLIYEELYNQYLKTQQKKEFKSIEQYVVVTSTQVGLKCIEPIATNCNDHERE